MEANWKNPSTEKPEIGNDESSVCVMVTPGCGSFQHPAKAWYNGDGAFYLASSGAVAIVDGWDYYPGHLK